MARESVDINKLTEVSPAELIEELSKENSDLRLRIVVLQKVVNKLLTHINTEGELDQDFDQESND